MDSTARIEETAGDWLARRDSGQWTEADRQAFDRWLNASVQHRVAYLRLESAWEDALRLKALGAGVRSEVPPPPGEWNLSPFFKESRRKKAEAENKPAAAGGRRVWSYRLRALAATFLIAAVTGLVSYFWPGTTYRTPVGGVASLPMLDGSKITLNTDSEIKVAMSESERRVDLKHGEAFFDVAKDPQRPFVVRAGEKRVVVVGTKFSVRREADDIRVVVTEGAVRVESASTSKVQSTLVQPLTAGSILRTEDQQVQVQHRQPAEIEEQLSWRDGVLILRNMTLADAVAEFNRYNQRKIVIEDPAIAALRVAGNFRATNVDAFIRLLEQGYPLRATRQKDRFVLAAR